MTANSGKHGHHFAITGVGFIAIALAAAGCADERRFAKEGATRDTKTLVVPARIVPPVTVARIEGTPQIWQLKARVAKALRDRDIPAVIDGPGKARHGNASYTLAGRAERLAPAEGSAAPRLRIAWTLTDAQGKAVGKALQISVHPVAADAKLNANIDKKADPVALDRLARIAAERLTPLVPHTTVNRGQTARAGNAKPTQKQTHMRDPIWRRIVAAPKHPPVTALGKQDAQRSDGGLSARFLKLRNVSTVAARSPEERIAVKRRAAQPREVPQVAEKRAAPPVIKPIQAEGPALTRSSVVTERIALVAKPAAHKTVHKTVLARAVVTPVAASGQRSHRTETIRIQTVRTEPIRKDDTIRPAPGTRKFAIANGRVGAAPGAKAVQVAEAAGDDGAAKGFWVQLASNPSPSASRAAWAALVARHADLLERQPHAINRADLGRKGVYYRLQLGPYPNIAQAKRICASLRAKQVNCLLMAARGQVASRGATGRRSQEPATRRVVTKPLAPKAKGPVKANRDVTPTKAAKHKTERAAPKTGDGKSAAGKASAIQPAAGAKPDPKLGAKPRSRAAKASLRSDETAGANRAAKPAPKPGLGARAEKPASRADKLPFQRSKALPGLPD